MTDPTTTPAAPFVLVHGAWGGAWIWRRVLAPLRAAGHEVHAVTLGGDGDRAHLRHRGIKLSHQAADVVAAVQAEELRGVILVGHSHGGMVVTGAAARPAGLRHPGRGPRLAAAPSGGAPLRSLPPRGFIDCNAPAYPTIAAMRERVCRWPDSEVAGTPTGQCPMVGAPGGLVKQPLADAARAG